MIRLTVLNPLLTSMRNQGITRCVFRYRRGEVQFSVVFTTETNNALYPLALLFGFSGPPTFAFIFFGDNNLNFSTFLESGEYKKLCSILNLKYDPNNKFSPAEFLRNFAGSGQIPQQVSPTMIPTPDQVPAPARYVSDADRPYFSRWMYLPEGNQVSDANYNRTLFSFGLQCATFCRNQRISSCWTAVQPNEPNYDPPPNMP
ncbi:hypothetical protein HLH36_13290 [Gluconacetobacter aggeris]|uniref:Uncharacterized protein n=1 Tax=Gluconacetobacter aggeris TaxID=1286186 RepID=A0A7W4NX35_9PROT|nr:DUF6037 family protein [Gluconacetobacter aggeris]MBB2169317.1 hypothetical protein [Gluconacetobacter aggeris]